MKCPACGNDLEQVTQGDVALDICRTGCGGIWFDSREIRKFDEPNEPIDSEILNLTTTPTVKVDFSMTRSCPKCTGIVMMRHLYSPNDRFAVDECPSCAGMWLDAGELLALRSKFSSDEERKKASQEYLESTVGPQLEAMRAESECRLSLAKKIANVFRFICPSYYLPGKQDWGAF